MFYDFGVVDGNRCDQDVDVVGHDHKVAQVVTAAILSEEFVPHRGHACGFLQVTFAQPAVQKKWWALGGYSASPVAAEGRIFLAGEEGKVAVLRAGRDWEVLAVNDLGESCYATPALSGGRIYLRTKTALYCFGKIN